MTTTEIQDYLRDHQTAVKPTRKTKPTVRPADNPVPNAERIRLLAEEGMQDPALRLPALQLIAELTAELPAAAPVIDGLPHHAERIVRALGLSEVTPGQIVAMVEKFEMEAA